eukprot:scaffold451_cov208-Pinguiococcus_pyrenoidosus.AAC.3
MTGGKNHLTRPGRRIGASGMSGKSPAAWRCTGTPAGAVGGASISEQSGGATSTVPLAFSGHRPPGRSGAAGAVSSGSVRESATALGPVPAGSSRTRGAERSRPAAADAEQARHPSGDATGRPLVARGSGQRCELA